DLQKNLNNLLKQHGTIGKSSLRGITRHFNTILKQYENLTKLLPIESKGTFVQEDSAKETNTLITLVSNSLNSIEINGYTNNSAEPLFVLASKYIEQLNAQLKKPSNLSQRGSFVLNARMDELKEQFSVWQEQTLKHIEQDVQASEKIAAHHQAMLSA